LKSLLQIVAAFALGVLGAGAALVAWDVHKLLDQSTRLVTHANSDLAQVERWSSNESQTVHTIIANAQTATQAAAGFSQDQRSQLQKSVRDTDNLVRNSQVVLRNAETLLYHTDRELNSQLLPHLDSEISATSTAAQFSFESFTHASDALTLQLNDPAISQTISGLNIAANSYAVAGQHFASMTAKWDDISAHGDHVAEYWDKKLTTPVALWKSLLFSTLRVGADSANIYAGFVK
jgi:hypothetical protein